jgi:hypothetical protein
MESLDKQLLGGDVRLSREDLQYSFKVGQELYGDVNKGETFLSLAELLSETDDAGAVAL